MNGRQGAILIIFSLTVGLGHRLAFAGLQNLQPLCWQVTKLLGVLGFSAIIISLSGLAWRRHAPKAEEQPFQSRLSPASLDALVSTQGETPQDILRRSRLVDVGWYSLVYPDVASEGVDVIEHYLHHGVAEGRNPNLFFDTLWYLEQNPDVRLAGMNPLIHFFLAGASEGRPAGPKFDTMFYVSQNDDVEKSGVNPLQHYLKGGLTKGRPATPMRHV